MQLLANTDPTIIRMCFKLINSPILGVVVGRALLRAQLQAFCQSATLFLSFALPRIPRWLNMRPMLKLLTRAPDAMSGNRKLPLYQLTETCSLLGHLDQEHFH